MQQNIENIVTIKHLQRNKISALNWFPLLPGSHWPAVGVPVRILCIGQIKICSKITCIRLEY